jgi:putative Mn2+ efflux pump MntP
MNASTALALPLLGVVLGFDSFRASLGLGLISRGLGYRVAIALAFALCDGLAPLIGVAVGSGIVSVVAPWIVCLGPVVIGSIGLSALLTTRTWNPSRASGPRWACLGLPLVLSLDNFVAGVALGLVGTSLLLSAIVIGLISGLLSLLGSCAGSLVGRAIPRWAERLGGTVLIALALGEMLNLL